MATIPKSCTEKSTLVAIAGLNPLAGQMGKTVRILFVLLFYTHFYQIADEFYCWDYEFTICRAYCLLLSQRDAGGSAGENQFLNSNYWKSVKTYDSNQIRSAACRSRAELIWLFVNKVMSRDQMKSGQFSSFRYFCKKINWGKIILKKCCAHLLTWCWDI